jgi:hypothetical protein
MTKQLGLAPPRAMLSWKKHRSILRGFFTFSNAEEGLSLPGFKDSGLGLILDGRIKTMFPL